MREGFWRTAFSHHQSVFTFFTFPSLNKLWNTCEQLHSWYCTASEHCCDLMKQLTMAALRCTNLTSGAWSAHAAVLTVLASLTMCVQGPHRPKASMLGGIRSKVSLIICKNRRTGVISDCVWEADTNVLGLGWGGITVCLSPPGVFWGLALLEGRCPLHLHRWLKSAQLESKCMAVLLGWGWCTGYWAKPRRSSHGSSSATAPAQPHLLLQS